MPPRREARIATNSNELGVASVAGCSKKNGSSCLSERIQAWQVSADTRQKRDSIAVIKPMRADSTSDSDSDSISCDESVVDELDDDHKSSLNALESSVVSTSTEIGEIKQSVQRLRAQRTRVEQLSQRNEELERQLDRQKAENETLQREVFTLRGAEQENVVYLQSVKLLKERSHELEDACTAKKLELRSATKKLSSVEHECDRLREEIQNSRQDHVDEVKVLRDKQKKLLQRIMQLEQSHEAQSDDQKRIEHHWKQKMKSIARSNSHLIDSLHIQLEQSLKETTKLKTEVHELETQAQNLLATTVRQTTIIEECDRVLSETKTQQQQTQCNYEEQLQLLSELSSKAQRLEAKVTSLQQSKGAETVELEREVLLLKSKLAEHQGQLKAGEEALKRKDKEIEVIQRTYVTRDNNRLSLDEVNKELQRNERKMKSDISELQIALRNATDEKKLLRDQVLALQERLESERKDRSRWANSRLKLLAEFCDEESKLSIALNHHNGVSLDRRKSIHKQITAPPRKTKSLRAKKSKTFGNNNYDGDDSEKESERRSSIVFG